MKLERINSWLSFGANLSVLAGIIFLAIEIQQNNELLETEVLMNYHLMRASSSEMLVGNAQLATAVAKEPSERTSGESLQIAQFRDLILRNSEWTFQNLPHDQLPINSWKVTFSGQEWKDHWNSVGDNYAPEFALFMRAVIQL